jgi:hypothetical protein
MNIRCLIFGHDDLVITNSSNEPTPIRVLQLCGAFLLCCTVVGIPLAKRWIDKIFVSRDAVCRRCGRLLFEDTDRQKRENEEYQALRTKQEAQRNRDNALRERFTTYLKLRSKA